MYHAVDKTGHTEMRYYGVLFVVFCPSDLFPQGYGDMALEGCRNFT